MTEIADKKEALPAAAERFILHWGEMGAQWGVNRSVSQIHALLYLYEKPLTAEEISETLEMARSNVSNSLKELVAWSLIRRVHVMGDRRDYFEAETDLWDMLTRIAAGRKAREIDPTIDMLRSCVADAKGDKRISPAAEKRMADMLKFLETLDRWYGQVSRIPRPKLRALVKMGGAISRFVGTKSKSSKAGEERDGTGNDG